MSNLYSSSYFKVASTLSTLILLSYVSEISYCSFEISSVVSIFYMVLSFVSTYY